MYKKLQSLANVRVSSICQSMKMFFFLLVILVTNTALADYWVSGTIEDENGSPLNNLRVKIMNRGGSIIFGDETLAATSTNSRGYYLVNIPTPASPQNIYIKVCYETPLTSPLAGGYKAVLTYDALSKTGCYPYPGARESAYFSSYGYALGYYPGSYNTNVEINVKPWASTRPPFTVTYDIPSYVSLVNWFQDVLAYLESMGITSAEWKMEEDWAIYVGLPGLCIFMGWNAEEKIYVPAGMLNNPLTGADYQSFCHEYAHRLSYIANGHKSAIPLSIYYPDP